MIEQHIGYDACESAHRRFEQLPGLHGGWVMIGVVIDKPMHANTDLYAGAVARQIAASNKIARKLPRQAFTVTLCK